MEELQRNLSLLKYDEEDQMNETQECDIDKDIRNLNENIIDIVEEKKEKEISKGKAQELIKTVNCSIGLQNQPQNNENYEWEEEEDEKINGEV